MSSCFVLLLAKLLSKFCKKEFDNNIRFILSQNAQIINKKLDLNLTRGFGKGYNVCGWF